MIQSPHDPPHALGSARALRTPRLRNHFFSHLLQNPLPRTIHEAGAADTMHSDRHGRFTRRMTHRTGHFTPIRPVAIKPVAKLPSHTPIHPQGRRTETNHFFRADRTVSYRKTCPFAKV